MTLNEYSEAIKPFAIYPGHTLGDLGYLHPGLRYVVLGLLEETGEVAGVVKKCMRDSDSQYTPAAWEKMVKELGDVLWYYTQLLYHLGLLIEDDVCNIKFIKQNPQTVDESMQTAVMEMCVCCQDIWRTVAHDHPPTQGVLHPDAKARQLVAVSYFLCAWARVVQLFGLSVSEIMEANIAKLQSRMARGMIGGSGDDR